MQTELNQIMEFGHVIEVKADGTIVDRNDIYAPELYDGETYSGWELMNGYSGQDRYSGPIMHASEYIGGGMAADIMGTPGIYVALVDCPLDGSEPEGWAVAVRS